MHKNGHYLRFMHQMLVLECDCEQNSWLLLTISDLSEETATERCPERYVMDIQTKQIAYFRRRSEEKKYLFTRREHEILGFLVQGLDSETIADKLFISVNTVNNHRQRILSKTNTANTTQVLLFAKRIGIV